MKNKYKINVCLGIRPDAIRSSVILKKLAAHDRLELQLVWSGQHWDHNLMGIFFDEMDIPRPSIILDCGGGTHYSQHARLIQGLGDVLTKDRPDVCLFLGDANAVMGCIAPLKMNIPIAHVESGQRSYDWNMPEERNRVVVDRISDVLYTYHHDTSMRLVQEGICPTKIVTIGNTIVDVLQHYKDKIKPNETCDKFNLTPGQFILMTLHRDGNMNKQHVLEFLSQICMWNNTRFIPPMPIVCILMPRLRQVLDSMECNKEFWETEHEIRFVEPLGFFDFISLEKAAKIEFTDSGTNQETSSLQGTPCVVLRENTERPETFESNITEMAFLGNDIRSAASAVVHKKLNPSYSLGNGKSSDILIEDLLARLDRDFDRSIHASTNKFIARNWL